MAINFTISLKIKVSVSHHRLHSLYSRHYQKRFYCYKKKNLNIGVGRFRILGGGGQGLEYWGANGGPISQQVHDVVMTSMRCNDVASTSFRRHVPTRFLINLCQTTTFLILKSDIIENSRMELRGIVLPPPSNQIKVTFIIILPFSLVHFLIFPVSHRN